LCDCGAYCVRVLDVVHHWSEREKEQHDESRALTRLPRPACTPPLLLPPDLVLPYGRRERGRPPFRRCIFAPSFFVVRGVEVFLRCSFCRVSMLSSVPSIHQRAVSTHSGQGRSDVIMFSVIRTREGFQELLSRIAHQPHRGGFHPWEGVTGSRANPARRQGRLGHAHNGYHRHHQ
jgi:hypothetical protein